MGFAFFGVGILRHAFKMLIFSDVNWGRPYSQRYLLTLLFAVSYERWAKVYNLK